MSKPKTKAIRKPQTADKPADSGGASVPGRDWPAAKVELRPIAQLIPYARNARTHSEAQIAQIAASIREWGWTMPVLLDETSMIIAGHGRVMAAQRLSITEVPCMTATGWSEAQKRAYVLADNQLALNAGWDPDMLKTEFAALREDKFEARLTGFSIEEMAKLDDHRAESFTPEDSDHSTGSRGVNLIFCGRKLPMTDEERDRLMTALNVHVELTGGDNGFAGWLCEARQLEAAPAMPLLEASK